MSGDRNVDLGFLEARRLREAAWKAKADRAARLVALGETPHAAAKQAGIRLAKLRELRPWLFR
jgi:hypothetical protein